MCVFQLSNHLFEELAMDVYDEVDRRENDSGQFNYHIVDTLVKVFLIIPEFRILRLTFYEAV